MAEKLLVYGVSSLIGRSVARAAAEAGYKVYGTYNSSLSPETLALMRKGKITLYKADLTDYHHAKILADEIQPDVAVLLAAHAKNNPDLKEVVFDQNRAITMNVGETLRRIPAPRSGRERVLVFASSVLVTGAQDGSKVVDEISFKDLPPAREGDHYTASKIWGEGYMDYLRVCGETPTLDTRVARFGNTTGPGREKKLIECDVADQVPQIQRGEQEGFELFNKFATADFSHSDDAANGVMAVVRRGVSGQTYNIVSGEEVIAEQLAKKIGELAGLGDVSVVSTKAELRGFSRFSNEKLRSLGWQRKFTFDQTIAHFYNWYEKQANTGDQRFDSYYGYEAMNPYRNLHLRPVLKWVDEGWRRDLWALWLQIQGDIPREMSRIRYRG
jgi:GDP-4-dehydro-6-deoxy-D-mannose reductase